MKPKGCPFHGIAVAEDQNYMLAAETKNNQHNYNKVVMCSMLTSQMRSKRVVNSMPMQLMKVTLGAGNREQSSGTILPKG